MFKLPPPGERRPIPRPPKGPSVWHLVGQLILVLGLIWYLLGRAS